MARERFSKQDNIVFNNKQCGWLFMTMKCSISFFVFAFDLLRRGFLFRLTNSTIYNV